MTSKFDSIYTSLLNEMMPVGSEFGSFAGGLRSGISSAPGEGYLIGAIAKALNISKEEAVNTIVAGLYDKLFGAEGINPANTEEEYRAAITDALGDIVSDLKRQHPEAKIPGAAAIRGYTARVISSLGTATKDFDKEATQADLKNAVKAATAQEPNVATKAEAPASVEDKGDEEGQDLVYYKAGSFDLDDANLEKKWDKLPDGNLEWSQVVKTVGTTAALELLDKGALLSTERPESEEGEKDFEEGDTGEVATIDEPVEDETTGVIKRPESFTQTWNRTMSPFAFSND